jgi:hypothetical protein
MNWRTVGKYYLLKVVMNILKFTTPSYRRRDTITIFSLIRKIIYIDMVSNEDYIIRDDYVRICYWLFHVAHTMQSLSKRNIQLLVLAHLH